MYYFRFVFILAAILFVANVAGAKNCKKGKPCGNTCISMDKTCHKVRIISRSVPVISPPERNSRINIPSSRISFDDYTSRPSRKNRLPASNSESSAIQDAISVDRAFEKAILLTVQARNLPLKQVLQQIADQTGAEITVEGKADNTVSADFTETDIAAALLRIAPDFNSIVLYGGAGPQDKTPVSSIRLYSISSMPNNSDVITLRPKTAEK